MKLHRTLAAALTAALLALGATQPGIAADAHSHAAGAPVSLALDHGKKWATDAPLRQRMGEIRTLLAAHLDSIHAGKLTSGEYAALGAAIEQKVAAIVAECKLPPTADAMLHLIVADLLAGADVMQGKTAGNLAEGAHAVVSAANAYGRYFNDAGWKPLG